MAVAVLGSSMAKNDTKRQNEKEGKIREEIFETIRTQSATEANVGQGNGNGGQRVGHMNDEASVFDFLFRSAAGRGGRLSRRQAASNPGKQERLDFLAWSGRPARQVSTARVQGFTVTIRGAEWDSQGSGS